ncbi:hypothetical protein ACFQ9Z_37900 [Streptomyces sp. NPDC056580]
MSEELLAPVIKAWDSGASVWSPAEREAYADDLGDAGADCGVGGVDPVEG